MVSYRVFLDKPVGIAIGFKPELSWDDLEDIIIFLDDKSPDAKVFALPDIYEVLSGDGRQLPFVVALSVQPGKSVRVFDLDIYPDPGLVIWRSPGEFQDWYNKYHGNTVVDRPKE